MRIEVLYEVFYLRGESFEGGEDWDVVAECFLLVFIRETIFVDEIGELELKFGQTGVVFAF